MILDGQQMWTATIARIVPGRLIYLDTQFGGLVVKPHQIRILGKSGDVRPYRGEPFEEIGIHIDTNVQYYDRGGEITVIIDPINASRKFDRLLESVKSVTKRLFR
jgi:hypothetical protein